MTRFSLSEFGTSFATRGRGEELRREILERAAGAESIVIDLDGVEHVSYSFADELLAKLCAQGTVGVEIVGAEPGVGQIVDQAVQRRVAVTTAT
jgi:anti-anti-sigma regulatory factor